MIPITSEKVQDIIETMIEWNMLDAERALTDKEYLIERIETYIAAAKIVRSMLNMPPLA